jgi:hypothetical protein
MSCRSLRKPPVKVHEIDGSIIVNTELFLRKISANSELCSASTVNLCKVISRGEVISGSRSFPDCVTKVDLFNEGKQAKVFRPDLIFGSPNQELKCDGRFAIDRFAISSGA